MVLLDGLCPNGPITAICRKNKWQFMIVLKDKSLPSVWEEAEGLRKLSPGNVYTMTWGGRRQRFWWVNDVDYYYGPNERSKQVFHLVVCEESWQEVDENGQIITKTSRHAWISSEPLHRNNLHERCNLGGRHRWAIESEILVEKRHGYSYEHCFSYSWSAMKGYHFLMRLALMVNVLTMYSVHLVKLRRTEGLTGFVEFLRETIAAPWLHADLVKARQSGPPQLRLAI